MAQVCSLPRFEQLIVCLISRESTGDINNLNPGLFPLCASCSGTAEWPLLLILVRCVFYWELCHEECKEGWEENKEWQSVDDNRRQGVWSEWECEMESVFRECWSFYSMFESQGCLGSYMEDYISSHVKCAWVSLSRDIKYWSNVNDSTLCLTTSQWLYIFIQHIPYYSKIYMNI